MKKKKILIVILFLVIYYPSLKVWHLLKKIKRKKKIKVSWVYLVLLKKNKVYQLTKKIFNDNNNNNNNNNEFSNQKKIQELYKEIDNQKNIFERKYSSLQEELLKVKSSLSSQDNSLLISKFQEFNDALIEMGKKLTSIENENHKMEQSQKTLSESISQLEKDMKENDKSDDDENSLKNLVEKLYDQNDRIREKISKLSDENYSLRKSIDDMKGINSNKDEKLKEMIEENDELKKKIKKMDSELNDWKGKIENNIENSQKENSRNERNEDQINRLRTEITQLKERIDKLIAKDEEKKSIFDDINGEKIKYGLIVIILLVVIYFIYKKCFQSDEYNSSDVRPMKLSQQYSGYGGYNNSLM